MKTPLILGLLTLASAGSLGCKTRPEATVKNNESMESGLKDYALGTGIQLPPVASSPGLTGIQPSTGVCVASPPSKKRLDVAQECVNRLKNTASNADAAAQTGTTQLNEGDTGPTEMLVDGKDGGDKKWADNDPRMGNVWTGNIQIIETQDDLESLFSTSLDASIETPVASGGISAKLRNEIKVSSGKFYVVFALNYLETEPEVITNPRLTEDFSKRLQNSTFTKQDFFDYCGNRFIKSRRMGASFYGIAEFNKKSESDLTNVEAAVSDIKTNYWPGGKINGGVASASKHAATFGSADIKFHKFGGGDSAVYPPTFEGMLEAAGAFMCYGPTRTVPVISWLGSYSGGLGGQVPKDLVMEDDPLHEQITAAIKRSKDARDLLDKAEAYPKYQAPQLTEIKKELGEYIVDTQSAVDKCRRSYSECNTSSKSQLSKLPPHSKLPDKLPATSILEKGKTYRLSSNNSGTFAAGLICKFKGGGKSGSGISRVLVKSLSSQMDGDAMVSVQVWRLPFGSNSYGHEVRLRDISAWIPKIAQNEMSNKDLAELLNAVYVPQTSNDKSWRIDRCWSR